MRTPIFILVLIAMTGTVSAAPYDVTEKSVAALERDMASGRISSEELVRLYFARIDALDRTGPALHSVIAVNPNALADAHALDVERKTKGPRGPLHGIPILVKDNIETADPVPTTAGSLALAGNVTHRDAPVVARLRAAGAVILGKTNLSEWANIRSSHSISGWSAVGGLVKNPYVLDRGACGSSSGSGAAIAASLAAAALGTETDGSLVCPGSLNGIVSFKPTVGLLSRTHIVPISHSQDTPGPMTRSVADAALLLSIMAGTDASDSATAASDGKKADYTAMLPGASFEGERLAVVMPDRGAGASETDRLYAQAIAAMKVAGADIIEIENLSAPPEMRASEEMVLSYELKHDLNAYLAGLPPGANVHTLADVIAFNAATARETALFGQDLFEKAQALGTLDDPVYLHARDALRDYSCRTLDHFFAENHVTALVEITEDPASRIDVVRRDRGGHSASFFPATAGYPHLTVPMGYVQGLPVGISFVGPAWSEGKLLALGAAFEKAVPARRAPNFIPSLETTPDIGKAFAPFAK